MVAFTTKKICVCVSVYTKLTYTQKATITSPEYTFNTSSERPLSKLSENHKINVIGPTKLKLWPFKVMLNTYFVQYTISQITLRYLSNDLTDYLWINIVLP